MFDRTPASQRCGAAAAAATALLLCTESRLAYAQDGPSPGLREAITSVVEMLKTADDASLEDFARLRLQPRYRESFGEGKLLEHLRALRQSAAGSLGRIAVEQTDAGLFLVLSAEREVSMRIEVDEAGKIGLLELANTGDRTVAPGGVSQSRLSWDTLVARMKKEEAAGFSGVLLATRDNREVLRQAYGLADRSSKRAMTLDAVFGIGSTPIDFTITSVLLLAQRGQLALDDTIDKFLPGVPSDKKAMTLRHLMTGRSGLPDFHDIRGVDWDPDLAWVDRDTAIRRILAQPLLFEPGKRDAHSHSAFGVLAAVVEIVSKQSYGAFIRAEIFKPAGMNRTGFYGETLGLSASDFATGYGESSIGLPNIPPNWGPTSWLVMGSGGMFSTLDDMRRYYELIDSGRVLSGEWKNWQSGKPSTGVGGSVRGFFIIRATNGRGTSILMLMNGEGRAPAMRSLFRDLERLVEGR